MKIEMLLEMAADAGGERVAVGPESNGTTYAELYRRAQRAAAWIAARIVEHVGLLDVNSEALPAALFGAAIAGVPFVPMNYRLGDEQLRALLARISPAVVIID